MARTTHPTVLHQHCSPLNVESSTFGPRIVIHIEIIVVASVTAVIFIDVYIINSGTLSTKPHDLYVTSTTVVSINIMTHALRQINYDTPLNKDD